MTSPILLVGAGRMGSALLKGWIREGVGPLAVVERSPTSELRELAESASVVLHTNIKALPAPPSACVIALKPQSLPAELVRLRSVAQSGALMISIAAGVKAASLTRAWGNEARVVRGMPNLPGSIGRGISALYARRGLTEADRNLAEKLLSVLGETLWIDREFLMDSVTAVSGSGPAYVFFLVEALERAALSIGLSRSQAQQLARATIVGAGALLEADKRSPFELRQAVTSPGGTTQAALDVLLGTDGLTPLVARAVRAARQRAEDLGK